MFKEFKEFAMRGNVMDMAVGIVIGAAFGKIVSSFVNDILMPPIGVLLGGVNFSKLSVVIKAKTATAPAVIWGYGTFINTIIDFLIIAFAIFLVVRVINRLKTEKPQEPTTKACPSCCSDNALKATRCRYCTSEIK